jgi:3-methylfumaryl-CoA hydratase
MASEGGAVGPEGSPHPQRAERAGVAESEWAAWVGRTEVLGDRAEAEPVRRLAATLDLPLEPRPGDALPELWYWLFFLPVAPAARLGADGHPRRGGFLPPVPLERRMWAGSRIAFHGQLRVGDEIERRSEILKVAEKEGRTGAKMAFVTVRHEVRSGRGLAASEEQDIAYLAMPKAWAPPEPVPLPGGVAWSEPRPVDPVLLFRFSALTFNGHRIHYDRAYATEVEKYPGLVVHGPLQAILLLGAAKRRHPDRRPASYRFRGLRPLFDFDRVTLSGRSRDDGGDGLDLWTANGDGHVAMQATVGWREP